MDPAALTLPDDRPARERALERAHRVFDYLGELVDSLPTSSGHRRLLEVHLRVGIEQVEDNSHLPAVQLPLLVYGAIAGEEGRGSGLPVALAGVCALLYLGADLFDNLAGGGLSRSWYGYTDEEANLAAEPPVEHTEPGLIRFAAQPGAAY